jgi:hypothetical protein
VLDPQLRRHPLFRLLAVNLAFFVFYFSLLFRVAGRIPLPPHGLAPRLRDRGGRTGLPPPRPRWKTLGRWIVLSAVAENAAYLGNPLSFTNVAVQPKRDAYR